MVQRSLAAAVLVAGLATVAPAAADPLLDAAGVVQKTVTRTCTFSGLGLPAACPLALPPAPAGRVMQVLSLSCQATVPLSVKSVDVGLSAAGQPTLFLAVQRVGDAADKARYRTFGTPTMFVGAAPAAVFLAVPFNGVTAGFSCGLVAKLL